MGSNATQSLMNALDQLLDGERRALISGDYDTLTELHDSKAVLLDKIRGENLTESGELTELRKKVLRNQELVNSALDGIRAVADRMAELRRVRQKLATYDHRGNRHEYTTASDRMLEKRA